MVPKAPQAKLPLSCRCLIQWQSCVSRLVPCGLQICCAEPLMQHPALREWLRRPLELRQETVSKAKQRLKVGAHACSNSPVSPHM